MKGEEGRGEEMGRGKCRKDVKATMTFKRQTSN